MYPPSTAPAPPPRRMMSPSAAFNDRWERDVWFVLGLSLAGLVVVAFLANGEGAGSSHHQFVRLVLAGLFVSGSGILGLVVMNAACGYARLDEPLQFDQGAGPAGTTHANPAHPVNTESDPHLERQTEYYRRRVYRESQGTGQTTPESDVRGSHSAASGSQSVQAPSSRSAPQRPAPQSPAVTKPSLKNSPPAPPVRTEPVTEKSTTETSAVTMPALAPPVPPPAPATHSNPTKAAPPALPPVERDEEEEDMDLGHSPASPTRVPFRRRRPRR